MPAWAVRPRLSVTSTPLPASLVSSHLVPANSRGDPLHMSLAISPSTLWAFRIWPQSRGNPMQWQQAEQINHDCQIRVGSGSVCQSPKKSSFLWSSSQVSGYLSEMAAMGCSALPLLVTAVRFVEALQEVCECGPGCLVCQGGTPQQRAQIFCQEELGNLCLWVARERRYLLVWG